MNLTGLTECEVKKRREEGKVQIEANGITKSIGQILKENIFTLFNLLNFIIAILLFMVKAYSNMLFIAIIIVNIIIGITQEYKAKKMVDNLSILNRPSIKVLRDGEEKIIESSEIVIDDVLVLESGNQVCNDSEIIDGEVEVNESLLTGESDAIVKNTGKELLSGSFIISGRCYAKVIHIGSDNYATKLTQEVKKEKNLESELLGSMQKVTKFTSWLIVPLGIMLFIEAYFLRTNTITDSVVTSAAALLGMLPKGLVLLISVSLANGVINLSKKKILIQNIYALENLAHVDMLCIDKTGTLTDGRMEVKDIVYMGNDSSKDRNLLCSYLEQSNDNNATIQALRQFFLQDTTFQATFQAISEIPFSSKKKWGAICFEPEGTIFMGAPEKIMPQEDKIIDTMLQKGLRVIAVGIYKGKWNYDNKLPDDIEPLYIISLEDGIRHNAKETLEYFYGQGIDVKVISGDHIKTVSEVAKKVGVKNYNKAIDLSKLDGNIDYNKISEEYYVFARVTPNQKKELVKALKYNKHNVAMTGDGVNDLMALREADCSIAIADGSDASRQIAQIVLLESDFTHLPQVILEGRRVINNVTRTAGIFFIKTIYSVLLTIFCLFINMPFPFIPLQITLVDAMMEAWPSFITIIERDTRKVKGKFLNKAIINALPFAFVVISQIIFVRLFFRCTQHQGNTIMYIMLIIITMLAVIKSCIPFNKLRVFVCTTMIIGTLVVLIFMPSLFKIATITSLMVAQISMLFIFCIVILVILLTVQNILTSDEQ